MGLPLYLVTLIINVVTHAAVSTQRLQDFLLAPETEAVKMIEGKDANEILSLADSLLLATWTPAPLAISAPLRFAVLG